MADLSSMFQNLGPTGGALMSGLTTGQDLASSMMQDQARQAQMDEILQRTAHQAEMAPLELQAKKQMIASNELKAKQERQSYYNDVVGRLIPELEQAPAAARHALMQERLRQAGLDLDEADMQWAQQHNGDELLKKLKKAHEWQITQSPSYRQALDVAAETSRRQVEIEGMREKAKAREAAEKGSRERTLQQDLSGAKTYQAQAVVYNNHASKARLRGDTEEAVRLEALAKAATAADLQARSASGDARAAQQIQLLQGLGVPLNVPAPGGAPAGAPRKPLSDY